MLDLLRGRTDTSARLITVAADAAQQAALSDAWMVLKAMDAYSAAQSGDIARCAAGAAEMESFGVAEGATAVCAEAAYLWVRADQPARVRLLVNMFHRGALEELPRDVNWLLTLQCVLEAALAVQDRDLIAAAARLLTPYTGRAVFNAGAVMFHGVVDDTLARASGLLGDPDTARRLRDRALSTYEHLGAQWWRERLEGWQRPPVPDRTSDDSRQVHLHPVPGGLWRIGSGGQSAPLRAMRGFDYLRELVRRPGQTVTALELVGNGTGVAVQSGLDVVDQQSVNAYRQRLRDLEQELAEAEEWSDLGRLDAIHTERDALLTELTRATGLHGRSRLAGSSQERARVAVRKAITAATDRIATIDPALALHLQTAIHTGLSCTYQPDPAEQTRAWILD